MAGILSFHFVSGNSMFHRSSPEVKFLLYLSLNIYLGVSALPELMLLFLMLILVLSALRISVLRLAAELKGLFWVLFFTWISRVHLSGGEQIFSASGLIPAGLILRWNQEGALATARFFLQLLSALCATELLTATTSPGDLQNGIRRITCMFNIRFGNQTALSIRIMLAALPYLADYGQRKRAAMAIRGSRRGRRSLARMKQLSRGMIEAVIMLSSGYSKAVLMRGWRNNSRPPDHVPDTASDLFLCLGALALLLIAEFIVWLLR